MGYTFDERMAVLGPHVHDGVPLLQAASAAGVPLRTAQRWLTAYRTQGAIGLRRSGRADKNRHRLPHELLEGDRGHGPSPTTAARYLARQAGHMTLRVDAEATPSGGSIWCLTTRRR